MNSARAVLVLFVLAAVAAGAWFLKSGGDDAQEGVNVASGASANDAARSQPESPKSLDGAASGLTDTNRAEVKTEPVSSVAGTPAAAADAGKEVHAKVVGRVVDEGRRPVPGATVRIQFDWFPEDMSQHRINQPGAESVKTGADGRFSLAVSRAGSSNSLVVEPVNHATARMVLPALTDGEQDVGDIVTPLGGSIAGRIVDDAGNAIPGAAVSAWSRGKTSGGGGLIVFGAARENERRTTTDARGSFRLDGLTPGEVFVLASKEAFTTESKKDVKVEAAGVTNDVSLTLGKGSEIRGIVVDTSGKGVADAAVTVMDTVIDMSEGGMGATFEADRGTRTDASGSFILGGLKKGSYNVTSRKEGFVTETSRSVAADTRDLRVTLTPGGSLWGIVSDDSTGKPVNAFKMNLDLESGMGFTMRFNGGSRAKLLTGAEAAKIAGVPEQPGLYAFATIDGRAVNLEAEAEGYTTTKVGPIELTPGGLARHDLSLVPEITVSGIVHDPKGQPVAKAQVKVTPVDPDGDTVVSSGGRRTMRVRARSVEASNDGSGPKVSFGDSNGKATTTDEHGRYVIRGLSEGKFTIAATHPEWATSDVSQLSLEKGERRDDVDLAVRAGGRLEGVAFDADGKPLPGARVTLSAIEDGGETEGGLPLPPFDDSGTSAVSDAKGHYEFKSILPGDYTAELHNPSQASGGAMIFMGDMGGKERGTRVSVHAGETTTQDLSLPPTGAIAGSVTEAGRALPGVPVALKPDGEMSFFPAATGTTNERGDFELAGVEPGKYVLEATPKGAARPFRRDVEIRARATEHENIAMPTGVLRGRVTDQDSHKGVAEVVIDVEPAQKDDDQKKQPREQRAVAMVMIANNGDGGGATTMRFGNQSEQVTTDKDGNFEVRFLEPGDYTVTIRGGGVIQQTKDRVRVFEGKESPNLDFDAARGSILKVKAVPPTGKELQFVHVSLTSDADPGNTEDRGEVGAAPVEFTGLKPGTYTVHVDSTGMSGEITVDVKSGDDRTVDVPIR